MRVREQGGSQQGWQEPAPRGTEEAGAEGDLGSWRERPEPREASAKALGRRVHGGKRSERRRKREEKGKTKTNREIN